MPDDFLGIAEHYGLMSQINIFVLIKTMQLISSTKDINFSCNLSANALSDENLLQLLKTNVENKKFDPSRMIIEITESVVTTHTGMAIKFINSCKQIGIKFALDDFGVGLSSLSNLKIFPVDYLKIDGSFIQNICKSEVDKQFVKSMIEISSVLNIKTIAEYVEDKQTMELLVKLGIDHLQGYYHGKPDSIDSWQQKGKIKLQDIEQKH